MQEIILLFDEQGTPTFEVSSEKTGSFLGVGVSYAAKFEEELSKSCNELFGLSNNRPLKNDEISKNRAIRISELISNLSIQVVIKYVDLLNPEFEQVVRLYSDWGSRMREKYRGIRGRPVAQVIHSRILDNTLFDSITTWGDRFRQDACFSVFIDDWSIPKNDVDITLKRTSEWLQDGINSLYDEYSPNQTISVSPIDLLNKDCPRKRIVDVIASAISRIFRDKDDCKFSEVPLNNILNHQSMKNKCDEITQELISFMRSFMDDCLRNINQ